MTIIEEAPTHVDPNELRPARDNVRQDLGDINELAESIRSLGLLQPIVVTIDIDGALLIVAGHRRHAAAIEAGLDTVPVYVREDLADGDRRTEAMLVENLQRTGLNPIEEATGYFRLIDLGHSQRMIAERVGCNQSHVSKRVKLLDLPEVGQQMVRNDELEVNTALKLATLPAENSAALIEGGRFDNFTVDSALRDYKRSIANERADASGLPRVGIFDSDTHAEVPEDEADGVYVSFDGKITWLREIEVSDQEEAAEDEHGLAEADADGPSDQPTPVTSVELSEAQIAYKASQLQREEAEVALVQWCVNEPEAAMTAAVAVIANMLRCGGYGAEPMLPRSVQENADDLTDNVMVALALLWPEVEAALDDVESYPSALPLVDFLGIELTDEQREALTDERPDWLPELQTPVAEVAVVASVADDDDEPEAPWSTYDMIALDRLINTIGTLTSANTIEKTRRYEAANLARSSVLAAIAAAAEKVAA